MEETRLAEIEERLGWGSLEWWKRFGADGSPDDRVVYWENAAEELLAEVRRLRDELDALQICGRRTGHGGQADVCKLPKGHGGCHKGNVYWWKT